MAMVISLLSLRVTSLRSSWSLLKWISTAMSLPSGWIVPSLGLMVNSSRVARVLTLKAKPTGYLPLLHRLITLSAGSTTLTTPKSRPLKSFSGSGNLTSTSILYASAESGISTVCATPCSSPTSVISRLSFFSKTFFSSASKVTVMGSSVRAASSPSDTETVNSFSRSSTPMSFHLKGSRQVLRMVKTFSSLCPTMSRSNLISSTSTSTVGLAPTHVTSKLTGVGLSEIWHTTASSTKPISGGKAYTLRSCTSSTLRSISGGSRMKTPMSLPPSSTAVRIAKVTLRSNMPLLEMRSLPMLSGCAPSRCPSLSLAASSGPNSNWLRDTTNCRDTLAEAGRFLTLR
mmetsp:Transcript_53049/g.168329  ORF Transcript_53049/g.168329 Transcript_53049/m.168329 type:complete len:344 (-) Transcript_53049:7425-8456(-)